MLCQAAQESHGIISITPHPHQRDGNLVMYDADSNVLWASHTSGNSGAVELVVQNDMNVVLYKSRGRVPLWATNTHTAVCPDASVVGKAQLQ